MEFAKKSWMREDRTDEVQKMLQAGKMAEDMKNNKARYKIIAGLMSGKSTDITGDNLIFATINRPRSVEDDERLTLEEYMKFFPVEVEDAIYVAGQRRSENEKAYNMNSKAKWHHLGEMPSSIAQLFIDMYPDKDDRSKAFKRFFNKFPKFRISSSRI